MTTKLTTAQKWIFAVGGALSAVVVVIGSARVVMGHGGHLESAMVCGGMPFMLLAVYNLWKSRT